MKKTIKKIKGVRKYFLGNKEVTEAEFDKAIEKDRPKVGRGGGDVARPRSMKRGYPIKSVALAVAKGQVKQAQEDSVKRGVPTEFTKGGRPILRDAAHRKAYLRAYGYHDNNSFTGY
jgi:hypothetical protein